MSNRWSAPPGPRLAFDNDAIPPRTSKPQAATNLGNQNSERDRQLIDRLAADLDIDPASFNPGRMTERLTPKNFAPEDFASKTFAPETLAPENGDNDYVDRLVAELNDAKARIDELELEADERLHEARIQIRAEIGSALGKLQDEADSNLEEVRRDADERAARRLAIAESRIRRLEDEVAGAKEANERAKTEAEAHVEKIKAQVNTREREHSDTERRLARVQTEVVQSHALALQARADAAALVERNQRETAERIAQVTADFDAQVSRMQGELHHYKTRVPDADARVVKVKEQAEQRIARIQARADERIAEAQAEADKNIARANAEADERLVRASTEIQQTFTRLETELASARQQTEQTRAEAKAQLEQMARGMNDHITREVTKHARAAEAELKSRYGRIIAAMEDQVARLEDSLATARNRADRAEHWLARIQHQVEGQLKPPAPVARRPQPGRV